MSSAQTQQTARIDALMEQASKALIGRRYFECEKVAASALRRAHAINDFERMTRIILPLQEARRQKRDLAIDSGKVFVIGAGEMPQPGTLQSGCYLVIPPRVGVDGRAIREMADESETPVVVIVREPTTRDGLCPIVSIGPVTIRAKVQPPTQARVSKPGSKKTTKKSGKPALEAAPEPAGDGHVIPEIEWFLEANEALGDNAIANVLPTLPGATRVDLLLDRLEALPDHEKLHQRLADACRDALREPPRKRRPIFDELEAALEGVPDDDDEDGDIS